MNQPPFALCLTGVQDGATEPSGGGGDTHRSGPQDPDDSVVEASTEIARVELGLTVMVNQPDLGSVGFVRDLHRGRGSIPLARELDREAGTRRRP